jgi:hypothetical protein
MDFFFNGFREVGLEPTIIPDNPFWQGIPINCMEVHAFNFIPTSLMGFKNPYGVQPLRFTLAESHFAFLPVKKIFFYL